MATRPAGGLRYLEEDPEATIEEAALAALAGCVTASRLVFRVPGLSCCLVAPGLQPIPRPVGNDVESGHREEQIVRKLERPVKREIGDPLRAYSVVEIACECGRSGCGEVIALPWSIYEQAKREPRRSLFWPGHELSGIGRALCRYDSFVVVAKV